jgi:hypothetical protein
MPDSPRLRVSNSIDFAMTVNNRQAKAVFHWNTSIHKLLI